MAKHTYSCRKPSSGSLSRDLVTSDLHGFLYVHGTHKLMQAHIETKL